MPRRSKGPRLWLAPVRRGADGRITHHPLWVIRDGAAKRSTGFGAGKARDDQIALANYILAKASVPRTRDRDPAAVRIAT
jgi:hypothetical protein